MLRRPKRNPQNHGFEQFQEIPIFSPHIWAWRHAGAWGSGTLKAPKKVDPLGTELLTRNQNILNISANKKNIALSLKYCWSKVSTVV